MVPEVTAVEQRLLSRPVRMDQHQRPSVVVRDPLAGRRPARDIAHDAEARVGPRRERVDAEGAADIHEPRPVG